MPEDRGQMPQFQQRVNSLSFWSCSLSADCTMSTCIAEGDPSTLYSNANPSTDSLTATPRNDATPAIWAPLSLIKLTQ